MDSSLYLSSVFLISAHLSQIKVQDLNTFDSKWIHSDFFFSSDWGAAVYQRSAVILWPQLWSPTPPIWNIWTWVWTSWRIQEWSLCLILWKVQTINWRLCCHGELRVSPDSSVIIWINSGFKQIQSFLVDPLFITGAESVHQINQQLELSWQQVLSACH